MVSSISEIFHRMKDFSPLGVDKFTISRLDIIIYNSKDVSHRSRSINVSFRSINQLNKIFDPAIKTKNRVCFSTGKKNSSWVRETSNRPNPSSGTSFHHFSEDSFPLGQRFNISFQFKSRVKSGLLLAATSQNEDNYVFVYLDKGNIVLTLLQNNIDEIHVVHWPQENNEHEVCDGQWHSIDIQKDLNVIRLHVDHCEVDEESLINEFDLYTNGPLYVGGMANPPPIIDDIPTYIGCLTNMKILLIDDEARVQHARALHAIDGIEYSCPTN